MQLIFPPTTLQHYSTIMSCTTEQMMQCMLANRQVVPVAIRKIASAGVMLWLMLKWL